MDHSRVRYLEAKRTVDERALDERVRRRLLGAVPDEPRVFEAGCGTGATVPRLLAWGVEPGSYVGVDRDEGVVAFARAVRPAELRRRGYGAADTATGFRVGDRPFEFRVGDAVGSARERGVGASGPDRAPCGGPAAAGGRRGGDVDLLVAGAFMDLVPLEAAVPAFERALAPGGLAYFPITFDGETVFQPDHPADDAVVAAYHDHIDASEGRDSRAGRHLASRLRERDGDLLAMAASDWVVRPVDCVDPSADGVPSADGGYPVDERYFIETILGFVEEAIESSGVEVAGAEEWLATRRRQLRAGELLYVAHQYDLLYRAPG